MTDSKDPAGWTARRSGARESPAGLLWLLGEREKELDCLYGISSLLAQPDLSLPEILQTIAGLIPPALQHAEVAAARICLNDEEFRSAGFRDTPWRMEADLRLRGEKRGSVEVVYLEERPPADQGPFLHEERRLLDAVTERLGHTAERFEAREELEAGRRFLETVLDGTPALIAVLDREFNFLHVNRAYAAADDREPAFFPGKNHFDLYPNPENEQIFRRVVQTGEPYFAYARPFEYAEHPERGVSHWDWSLLPMRGADGSVDRLLLTLMDVTARVRAQEAQCESEERFRQFAENVDEGFWLATIPSPTEPQQVLYANPAFEAIFGLGTGEAYAGDRAWAVRVHPGDREHLRQAMREFRDGLRRRYDVQFRIVHPSRGVRWLCAQGFPAGWDHGRLDRVAVLVRDITERKWAERRLRRTRRQLARRVQGLTAIHRCSERLQRLYTPQALADDVISVLDDILHFEYGAVLLTDEATGRLIPFALSQQGRGPECAEADKAYVAARGPCLDLGITGWVARTGESVRLGDVRQDPRYFAVRDGIRSELCVPLRFGDRILGVVNVETTRPDAYTAADQRVLETVASHISVALENARLFEEQQQLARTLEDRVAERTAELSAAVERLRQEVAQRKHAEAALARSHRLVAALDQVSARIQDRLDAQAVFETLGSVVAAEGLTTLVLLLDAQAGTLRSHHASAPPSIRAGFEARSGFTAVGAAFPADRSPFADVLRDRRPLYLAARLPALPGAAVSQRLEEIDLWEGLPDLDPAHPAILAPLIAQEGAFGVLIVSGAGLREDDVTAYSILADQVANALERLRLGRQAAEVEILREVDRLRSELIANVSHEIRTPLGLIDVLTTSLLMDDVCYGPDVQREFLAGIKEATDRLSGIVENLLDLGRLDGGRLRLDRRPVDLAELAGAVVPPLLARAGGYRLRLDVEAGKLVAWADAGQVERVVSNLVDNAVKYSPAGGEIRVAGYLLGDEVVLSVSDQGIGIPESEQERIFERFYRVDGGGTRGRPGVGLGLAVCRGILSAHGGRIWVESRPGEGSTFYISLPALTPALSHGEREEEEK